MKFVWKNYLLLLSFLLLSLALLTTVISVWQAGRMLDEMREEQNLFAVMAATQVETGYHEQVWPLEMLARISRAPDFVYWRVVDGSGRIILSHPAVVEGESKPVVPPPQGLRDAPLLAPGEQPDTEAWIVPMRMRTDGHRWTFWLGFSTRTVTRQVRQFVGASARFGGAIAVVLIPFSLLATRKLLRPVEDLSQAAGQMADGNLEFSLPPAGPDEMGRLVGAFGAMADNIRARDAEIRLQMIALQNARDDLEDRVQARTAELTRANRDLRQEVLLRTSVEKALRESEQWLRTVLDNVQTGILMIDARTHAIADANTVAIDMIGLPKDQIIGKVCHHHVCPADAGKCPVTDLNETIDRAEQVLVRGNGEACPIIKTVVPLTIHGRPYLLESFVDISDRKRLEDELRQSYDLLEQRVAERTAELMKAGEQLTQAQMDLVQSEKMSMLGQLVAGVAHEINTPTGAILNVMTDARDHLRALWEGGEACLRLAEEPRSWLGKACQDILSAADQPREGSRHAARRQVEQELAQRGCDNPRRLAPIVIGCFGEEWRNDDRLLKHLDTDAVVGVLEHMLALRASTDISLASARKIARIVRALRYYSHAGQDELSDANINESIDNTLVILQNRIKHIAELRVALDPALPTVRCGPDISQVWTNILNNACDAIEENHREGMGRIEVVTRLEADQVVVRISNDGPPIPEDTIGRIFGPFYTTKAVGKGTGLGLGICMGIVQHCGGSIEAANESGCVTFEVRLPVAGASRKDGEPARAPVECGSVGGNQA